MRKVCGVGLNDMRSWCTNITSPHYNEYEHRVYQLWSNMLNRSYKRGLGSTVCDRWKLFSNFVKDVRYIQGYNLFLRSLGSSKVFLDKDTKYFGNRVYDPSTVRFITVKESAIDVNKRTKSRGLKAVNITDSSDVRYYDTVTSVGDDNFDRSAVAKCCQGKQKSHKGYKWEYV